MTIKVFGGGLSLPLTGELTFSGTTIAGINLNNLTTAQKDALTPTAGMLLYDSTLTRLQLYAGGGWRSFVRADGDTMTGALLAASGTAALPSMAFSADPDTGMWRRSAGVISWSTIGIHRLELSANTLRLGSSGVFGITSGSAPSSTPDTAFSRISAGIMGVGTGAAASVAGSLQALQYTAAPGTAIPAGGSNTFGFKATSTSNFGCFFGSGAPTMSAAQGSTYQRSDGSSVVNRFYINTDGGTTWTAVTTVV